MAQGGDITREDGSGGESIYGPTLNEDPAALLALSHDARGLLRYVCVHTLGVPI